MIGKREMYHSKRWGGEGAKMQFWDTGVATEADFGRKTGFEACGFDGSGDVLCKCDKMRPSILNDT